MPSLSASMATAAALGLLFLAAPRPAAAGVVWDEVDGGQNLDVSTIAVSVNDKGYSCQCGWFSSLDENPASLHVGQFSLPVSGLIIDSAYIAKRDPNGKVLWAKAIAGDAYTECYDVAIDEKGNCVAVGGTGSSEIVAGSFTLTNPNTVPYRRLSEASPRRRRLTHEGPQGHSVKAEGRGFGGDASASNVQVAAIDVYPTAAWIAVFSPSGTVTDAQLLAAEGLDTQLESVELKKGKAYLAGGAYNLNGQESDTLNGFDINVYGDYDMLLAKFDYLKTETFDWVVTYGGDGEDFFYTTAMSNNKFFVGGYAYSDFVEGFGKNGDQEVDTDGGNLTEVLAEVSMKTGQIISYTNFGGEIYEYQDEGRPAVSNAVVMSQIAADKQGNLYVAGKFDGVVTIGFDRKGNEIILDNGARHTPGANETITDDGFVFKFKPSSGKTGWFVEFTNTWGNADGFDRVRGLAVGPKGYPYAYFYTRSNTDVELDDALTLTDPFAGQEIGVTAIMKISPKTGEVVEAVNSGYSEYTYVFLDVDKQGYVYATSAVNGDWPPAALKVCGDTFDIDPGFFGTAVVKWSTLSCSAARKCTATKGCF